MEHSDAYTSEIDLKQLVKMIVSKWYIAVGCLIVGMLIFSGYAYYMLADEYISQSSIIVQVHNEANDNDYQNLLYGQNLVNTYSEIATSSLVLNQVLRDLDLDFSKEKLNRMISVSSVSNTLIVKLSVTASDGETATAIANHLVLTVQRLSLEFDGLENVEILDQAELPTSPSGPNRLLYVIGGILIGSIVGLGIIFLIEFMNRKIKYPGDIENILNMRLVGLISYYNFDEGGRIND